MTIYVFIISLILLVAFVTLKIWEDRRGMKTAVSKFIAKGDEHIFHVNGKMRSAVHENKERTIFFVLVHLPERIEILFTKLKQRAHDRYFEMKAKMRGKQTLRSDGKTSPFMRNISQRDEKK